MENTNYRATCYFHMEQTFPVREDKQDAREDKNSHGSLPGGHHLAILEVDLAPTEVDGFPAAGYSKEIPELCERIISEIAQLPPEILYAEDNEENK